MAKYFISVRQIIKSSAMLNNQKKELNLIDELYKGNETAITEIYNRYGRELLTAAYSHLKDKTEAEKVVLSVLTELWDERAILRISSPKDYLETALKHAVLQSLYQTKFNSLNQGTGNQIFIDK
jgi:excinuclease UvrABC nuclease subunit